MRRVAALILAALATAAALANIPANIRINGVLTPSGRIDTRYLDGNDGSAAIPLSLAPIANISALTTDSSSLDLCATYLTAATSPDPVLSVVPGFTLPTGFSLGGTNNCVLSWATPAASTTSMQIRATRTGNAPADSKIFSLIVTTPPITDALAPTIPEGCTTAPGTNTVTITCDASTDPHDGTNAGSGIDHYELLLNGAHVTDIAAAKGISVPFTQTILGSFSPTATSSQSGSSYTLTAAGTGFHNTTTEQGIFRGGAVTGDFTLTTRVASFTSAYQYSTGGLMVYETVAQGKKFFFHYAEPGAQGNGPQTKNRPTDLTNSVNLASAPGVNPPNCLKVMRVGSNFTSYYSSDSQCATWTLLTTKSIAMASTVYAGLALSSQNAGVPESITLSQVSLTQSAPITYTHTTATGGSYTVKAYDVAGNVSAASAAMTGTPNIPTVPTTSAIKWHPGFYVLGMSVMKPSVTGYTSSEITEMGAMPNLVGREQLVAWGAIETSRGVYNFTALDTLLSAVKAQGKKLVLQVLDRAFASADNDRLPAYLATEPNGGGGWFTKPNGGNVAKLWLPAIAAREQALFAAIGAHYDADPDFEGIFTCEADPGFSSGPSDYTATAWATALQNIAVAAVAAFPHSNIWASTNFLPTGQAATGALIEYYRAHRVGFTTPDVVVNGGASDWGTQITLGKTWNGTAWVSGGTNYTTLMPIAHDVETPEMGAKEGGFSADAILNTWSHVNNHDEHLFVSRKLTVIGTNQQLYWNNAGVTGTDPVAGHFTPDAKTAINSGSYATYTICPANYTSGCDTGVPFFTEDFAAGYTWGTLPMTTKATAQSQMGTKWPYIDWPNGHGAIDAWPPDTSKKSYRIGYVNSDDADVIQHKFDPTHANGTARPTEIYVQYKEYRPSTFDCGPSKDVRWGVYRATEYGGLTGAVLVDLYSGFTNGTVAGTQPCITAGINIQGAGAAQVGTGDANTIQSVSYSYSFGTAHTIEYHIRINTPGNADGAAEEWVDGLQILSRTNVKMTPDTWPQGYLDFFQLGMSATNGGQAFASTSFIYRTDVKIATSFIP